MLRPLRQEAFEEQAEKLQRHVLERQGGTVEQFQQPVLPVELDQRRHRIMGEPPIGRPAQVPQFILRQRIAHEIHDTLAQGLSSIQMLLRVAEQEINSTPLSEEEKRMPLQRMELARNTAADNLQEARAMIAALQPAALSKTSLEGAFHRVAEHIVGPEVTIEVEGAERQLPMRTEAALLRIGQGALGNVSKHAGATRCHVTLTYAEDEVRLDVVDNGRGFDPAAVAQRPAGLGHIGIDAMRQRAQEQGGALVVESAPGEGTALSVSIPISEEETDAPKDSYERIGETQTEV